MKIKSLFRKKQNSIVLKQGLFWTPRKVLLILGVLLSAALMYGQTLVSTNFTDFSLNVFRTTAGDTLTYLVNDRIRLQYRDKITPHVGDWSRFGKLVSAVRDKDPKKMQIHATALHNEKVIRNNEFDLVNVNIFDKDLNLLSVDEQGNGQTILVDKAVKDALLARDKASKRKQITYYWQTKEGLPVHSVIAPIGGFRVAGFIEVVTNPIGHLIGLGEYLNGDLAYKDASGNILLEDNFRGFAAAVKAAEDLQQKEPETSSEAAPEAVTETPTDNAEKVIVDKEMASHQLDYLDIQIPGSNGEVWAIATLTRDVTDFTNASADIRNSAIVSILVGLVIAWIGGALLLKFSLFNKMKSFANALTEISHGHTDIPLPKVGNDEFKDMREALISLRTSVEDSFQFRNMIQSSPIPTSLVGLKGTVYFLNAAGQISDADGNSPEKIWDVIGLEVEELTRVGDDTQLPHMEIIQSGDDILELRLAAVENAEGKHVRTMVSWENVTERETIAREIETQREQAEKRAAEILERQAADEERARQINTLIQEFDNSIAATMESVATSTDSVKSNAHIMADIIETTVSKSQSMAIKSTETTDNVQVVAEGADRLSNSVTEMKDQVQKSTSISRKAAENAAATSETINGLAVTANRIGEVISLIEDIASQTNLLALNATIEAARAGDAGKGFAVVASEVKSLASQTEKATEEISSQITAIQGATSTTVEMTTEITTTISQINDSMDKIGNVLSVQLDVIEDIGGSIQSTTVATREVSETVQEVGKDAERSGNAAGEQQVAADQMVDEFSRLSQQIQNFLQNIRAA
jgi:methyl-accepting chemotaxis protein